ncbi:MAG: hypothetical protein MZU95_00600 [Desulfomicrobium escambiense]|nr:hypothetical protein [Desulfomicrobium escambiense]
MKEIKELAECAASLSRGDSPGGIAEKLHAIAERKKAFDGAADLHPEPVEAESKKIPFSFSRSETDRTRIFFITPRHPPAHVI